MKPDDRKRGYCKFCTEFKPLSMSDLITHTRHSHTKYEIALASNNGKLEGKRYDHIKRKYIEEALKLIFSGKYDPNFKKRHAHGLKT